MRIQGNGYVGIGTTSPVANLDVRGASGTTQAAIGQFYNSTNGGYTTIFGAGSSSVVPTWTNGSQVAEFVPYSTGNGIIGTYYGSLVFQTNARTNRMIINSSGYVGIGTATPDEMLSVNGNIHAQEVLVNLTGFEDRVFKKTYHLPTLHEVKTYIDKNHHLPEVPSEAQVIKNGINLGDMDRVLTKKVEELTLYLIQKDRLITDQQQQLKGQQQQIDLLKKQLDLIKKKLK